MTWPVVVVAVLVLLVIRPLSGLVSLVGFDANRQTKGAIAFFGIRGLGSFYYVAYALGQADFRSVETVWATVCCVVLASIIIHGSLVTPIMRRLDASVPR